MDPSEVDAIVQRLVANPHDEEALAYAHHAGASDPKSYAMVLEKVGNLTSDPAYAAHWLSEAANVWLTTLGDAHRAARILMTAIDRDPTQQVAAERLAQLYRDKGDVKALVALLDRRTKAMSPLLLQAPELRPELAGMHEELGRLWNEPPLSQPRKAVEHFRRALELDPQSAFAAFSAREILKGLGAWEEALALYEPELALEQDPARRVALLRDEAETRRAAGDLAGASRVLAQARQLDDQDPALQQEYASTVVDRVMAGEKVAASERAAAAELLVGLAEVYDGEHGLAYSGAALDIEAGHERAMQLYSYYARTLQREGDLPMRYLAYLEQSPDGSMAGEARHFLAASYQSAGQIDHAIQILEPLAEAGDAEASAKIRELREAGAGAEPAARPSAAVAAAPQEAWPESPRSVRSDVPEAESPRRGPLSPDRLQGVLDAANMLANKGKKAEAYAKYKEVLDTDPAHPEALAWVEDYLRSKREYATLRDVLLASVRAVAGTKESLEARKERLREVAGLCEGQLRDVDGAVSAYKQLLALDRADESARQALSRLLEKTQRWDDLANVLEQEATIAIDVDQKIALEKKLAKLHEEKRRDMAAAAEAWARIARLEPEDDRAITTASRLFERAGQLEMAARVIADNAAGIDDMVTRGQLLERLAELREQLGDGAGAGDAFADAAEAQRSPKLWEAAERCFLAAERFDRAANAACQRALLAGDTKQEAQHYARAAELFFRAGDEAEALAKLEQAVDLDPSADELAAMLGERYTEREQWDKLVALLVKRGDRLADRAKRTALRRQAAITFAQKLNDRDAAREQWLKVLEDGDDREALEKLVDFAVEREDHGEATTLLRRLTGIAVDKADKARVALREAELLAEGVGDVDTAIHRYEWILSELDPTCRPALQAIADLQEARENAPAAAEALERELKLVADPKERGQIAARLARLYEQMDDPRQAIRALDTVRKADPEDFEALEKLCELCERTEQWDRLAELLAQRIEIEADEEEAAKMTLKLATILADRLDRGDEALAALTELADQGDPNLRAAYVDLGDRLGWKGIVASKLVEWWFDAKHGAERTAALRGAFDRFAEVGRDQDAVRVAIEVIRAKGGDRDLATRLEQLATKTGDHDALALAEDLLVRELTGLDRAAELVRQAEVRASAGGSRLDAIAHGESGLAGLSAAEAEPLLERLAALAERSGDVVDLYERHVSRTKVPQDRMRALAKAAQVAAARSQVDRARTFLELALAGVPSEETLAMLQQTASEGDRASGGERLRRALCQALSTSGGGARDGGRTRGALLRRAADIAYRDLRDVDHAFAWMGEALVAYVDGSTLDALEQLATEVGDLRRAETAISHALTEVYDGPLVKQLLARRARIRKEQLGDRAGAAADLKKLHDLAPQDATVLDELSALLAELGDYRGMVQLYEDQILRGKDIGTRAELARKVARMWEEQLQDPREAADAWRRVLRMKAGDPEATAGLERAKSNMLKKPDPSAGPEQYAPPRPPPAAVSTQKDVAPAPGTSSREVQAPSSPLPSPARPGPPTDTASFVAALTDTSEHPVSADALPIDALEEEEERALSVLDDRPRTRDTTQEPHPLLSRDAPSTAVSDLAPTPIPPPPAAEPSAEDLGDDVELVSEEATAVAGAALLQTSMTPMDGGLDFGDEDEHTVFRPFTPPEEIPPGEPSSEMLDLDEVEEVNEDDGKPRSIPPPLPRNG
jgi:tetratricopeptide (TPR) repeat protein